MPAFKTTAEWKEKLSITPPEVEFFNQQGLSEGYPKYRLVGKRKAKAGEWFLVDRDNPIALQAVMDSEDEREVIERIK